MLKFNEGPADGRRAMYVPTASTVCSSCLGSGEDATVNVCEDCSGDGYLVGALSAASTNAADVPAFYLHAGPRDPVSATSDSRSPSVAHIR